MTSPCYSASLIITEMELHVLWLEFVKEEEGEEERSCTQSRILKSPRQFFVAIARAALSKI